MRALSGEGRFIYAVDEGEDKGGLRGGSVGGELSVLGRWDVVVL